VAHTYISFGVELPPLQMRRQQAKSVPVGSHLPIDPMWAVCLVSVYALKLSSILHVFWRLYQRNLEIFSRIIVARNRSQSLTSPLS
jgi:hypothetical protein